MQELALEVMQTWDARPFPIVQGAGSLDKDVTLVTLNKTSVHISDLISLASTLLQFPMNDWLTCISHLELSSFHAASETCCFNFIYFIQPYLSATRFQYW